MAIALLGSPRLLALDDLDLKLSDTERTEAWALLRSIAARGTTVLAVCSEAPADAVALRTGPEEPDAPDAPDAPEAPGAAPRAADRKVTWGSSAKSAPDADTDADADARPDAVPDTDAAAENDGDTARDTDTAGETDTDTDTENDDTKGEDDALAEAGRA